VIEALNAGVPIAQSSCVTCHGYASFGADGSSGGPPPGILTGNVDPRLMQGFVGNDFIWGLVTGNK
jgi:hypothetical protein